jgi:riboflavin kinase / FMN adenylyltransferase
VLIVQNTEQFRIESPTIATLGTFDGVHLGHQKILKRLKELKEKTGLRTVVLTFEPHPRKLLFPEQKDLKLLSLTEEKLELLEKYGVDVTVVYPFTKAFSQMESKDYIGHMLVKQLNVKHLVIGYDHKFGKDRSGNIETLRQSAKKYEFSVEEISAEDIDNIAISSSKIRKALEEGKVEQATEYLGHRFFLNAHVVKGKQLGRTLGYPTANLKTDGDEKIIPGPGVYFVQVKTEQADKFGMMSIGTNPTIDDDKAIKLEVHIFNFTEDIYSKQIKVIFIQRLRDEKKFSDLTELKAALCSDEATCLQLLQAQ